MRKILVLFGAAIVVAAAFALPAGAGHNADCAGLTATHPGSSWNGGAAAECPGDNDGSADVWSANGGNDRVFPNGGADYILAGKGSDYVDGGNGNDDIFEDTDILGASSSGGDDELRGNDGADYILGGTGTDILEGGPGTNDVVDHCHAGGTDTVGGFETHNHLSAGSASCGG